MREGYINTKNGNIWYSVYGEDRKKDPLLVLHGGPGFLSMPEVVSDLCAERPVYFYDQLGCGRSDRAAAKSRYTVGNYVNELAEVRKALGLEKTYLLGFSWGTMLACSYMLEKKPDGIKGLVLCGPYLSSKLWHNDQRHNIEDMPEEVKTAILESERTGEYGDAGYQAAVMRYYKKHVCRLDPWPDFLDEAFSRLNTDVYLTMWGPSEFTITGTLKDRDILPELGKIRVPVLLIHGEYDEAGAETVEAYRKAFADASATVIPEASHLHHIERPEAFLRAVRQFVKN